MPRRVPFLLAALAIALLGALVPAAALSENERAATKVGKATATSTFVPVTPYTTAGALKITPTPPTGPAWAGMREIEGRKANPEEAPLRPKKPYRGPAIGAPTELAIPAPGSTQAPTVDGPGAGIGGGGAIRVNAREQAATDLTAFRVSEVANTSSVLNSKGNSLVNWISDATTANDRNAVLYTANWFTAYSSDNGMTWGFFNPYSLPTVGSKKSFCCDQFAVSVQRGGYANIVWVLQYSKSTTNNGYRVVVLKDRSGVESLGGTVAYCSYEIWSDRIGLPANFWMDYPAVQASSKYLYLTANAGAIGGDGLDRTVIWRTPVSGLDDCSGGTEAAISKDRTSARPVTGAGSTMYFGVQPRDGDAGSKFEIGKVADSSKTIRWTRRDISDWPTGTPSCVLTDHPSNDPCGRMDAGRVLSGYRSSSRLGFFFTTGSGGSSTKYPYVRLVRFDPSSLALTGEADYWNANLAWTLPSSGVNSRGDVGGTMTAVGGATAPTAQAFMSDSYSDWSPLGIKGLAASEAAPAGDCSSSDAGRGEECLGDYFTTSAYTGCTNTFATVATVERTITSGSVTTTGSSDRFAWFGREQDGCVDMQVSDVQVAATGAQGGGTVGVSDATWNTGGIASVATTTTYYLSRDATVGGTDPVIGSRTVAALAAGASNRSGTITVTLPDTAFGSYVVIACADSADLIDEVSDTNNCSASGSFDVAWTIRPGVNIEMWGRELESATWKGLAGAVKPGSRIQVTGTGRISPVLNPTADQRPFLQSAPPVIPWDIFLTVDQRISLTARPIGKIPTGPLKPRVLDNGTLKQWVGSATGTAILPKAMPAGRYWVTVCTPIPDDDPVPQRACSTAKTPIVVAQKAVRRQTGR